MGSDHVLTMFAVFGGSQISHSIQNDHDLLCIDGSHGDGLASVSELRKQKKGIGRDSCCVTEQAAGFEQG